MATEQGDISAAPPVGAPAPDYAPGSLGHMEGCHEYSSDDLYKRRSVVRIVMVSTVAALIVLGIILGLSLMGGSG